MCKYCTPLSPMSDFGYSIPIKYTDNIDEAEMSISIPDYQLVLNGYDLDEGNVVIVATAKIKFCPMCGNLLK